MGVGYMGCMYVNHHVSTATHTNQSINQPVHLTHLTLPLARRQGPRQLLPLRLQAAHLGLLTGGGLRIDRLIFIIILKNNIQYYYIIFKTTNSTCFIHRCIYVCMRTCRREMVPSKNDLSEEKHCPSLASCATAACMHDVGCVSIKFVSV